MVKVPVVDGPAVSSRAAPNVQIRNPVDMSGVRQGGQDLMRLGADLARENEERRRKQLKIKANEFKIGFSDELRGVRGKYLKMQGGDAMGATESFGKELDEIIKKRSDAIKDDPELQEIVSLQISGMKNSALDSVFNHESRQEGIYRSQQEDALIKGAVQDAIEAQDDKSLMVAMDQAYGAIYGSDTGQSVEVQNRRWADTLSAIHEKRIEARVDADPIGMASYFASNKDDINPDRRDNIEKMISGAKRTRQGQLKTDEIMSLGLDRSEALERAREETDPETRDDIVRRVNARYNEQEKIDRDARVDADREGEDLFNSYGTVDEIPQHIKDKMSPAKLRSLANEEERRNKASERENREEAENALWNWISENPDKQLEDAPESLRSSTRGVTLRTMENHIRARAKQAEVDARPETDWDVYDGLFNEATNDPKAFVQEDLLKHRASLSDGDYRSLKRLQVRVKSDLEKDDSKSVATLQQQISSAAAAMGWDTDDKEKKGKFEQVVRSIVDQKEMETGKSVSYQDRQAIIDMLLIEGEIRGSGLIWNDEKPLFEAIGDGEQADFQIDDVDVVPVTDRALIEEALTADGREPTDDLILKYYNQRISRLTEGL